LNSHGKNIYLSSGFIANNSINIGVADFLSTDKNVFLVGNQSFTICYRVMIGPVKKIYSSDHDIDSKDNMTLSNKIIGKAVKIASNLWIGKNVVLNLDL
jgi:acetyltransferase-like isoleucine patch superfamily enzyme